MYHNPSQSECPGILETLKHFIDMDIDKYILSKRESYHLLPYVYPPFLPPFQVTINKLS